MEAQQLEQPPELVKELLEDYWLMHAINADNTAKMDQIKAHVLAAVGFKNGTITVSKHGFKISTVGKSNYTVNPQAWEAIKEQFPEDLHPVRETVKLAPDIKMINAIKKANPEMWKRMAPAFANTPAKPTVKITQIKKASNDG
tara:strand:+ start:1075 stop:1503 length:429 start_codon:yes stop_codon:yes gene_type:complete